MTITNPIFLAHFHQEPTLQNDNPLNTSISLTFHPLILRGEKNPKAFCRENSWQPRDTSGYFYWILGVYGRHVVARWLTCCCLPWHYKMTTLQVLETSTSTKWQPGVVFQLPTLPVQSHSSTTPTQKQHVPPYPPNKNSPKVCCGERMCIMSPSLTSLKLLYHTWSALLQSFSYVLAHAINIVYMLRFSLSISSTSGVRGRGGYWNYKMANQLSSQTNTSTKWQTIWEACSG